MKTKKDCTTFCDCGYVDEGGNMGDIRYCALHAAAPELLDALLSLTQEIRLSKLNVKSDFSLINAHAGAMKVIKQAEGR
jgi:hypothetical protein